MPRKEKDYSNTVIYKIVCNDLTITDVYVGHTTDFTKRKNSHKSYCINSNSSKHNIKLYSIIRLNGGWENWTMLQIEKYPCKDVYEARNRERYWFEILNCNMNYQCPNRKKTEYYIVNKERKKEIYEKNKESILEKRKNYYEKNKVKIQEKNSVIHKCICEGHYTGHRKNRHEKTILHQEYIKLTLE